jgi:ABC-type bacteriocin/lantibiotic exporter with double-glycine peptidase domain
MWSRWREKPGTVKTVWRVFAYLKRYPMLATATLACTIVSTLMVIVFPAATKYVLDDVINGHHPEHLLPLLLVVAVAVLLQIGFDHLRLLLNNTFEQNVIFDLRSDLYSHIQTLPLRWFDNRATGDLMTRILEDVTAVERALIDGIEEGTVAVLQIIVVLVGMFYLSAKLAVVALAPVPFLAGGAIWVYAQRPPAIPPAARRRLGHEFAPARQSLRHSSDQEFRARASGILSLQ